MKIFIAGASGYLGSYLVNRLASEHQVFALMRSKSSKSRIADACVDIINLDINDAVERVFSLHQPDVVINTVALYGRNGELLTELIDANIKFPSKLLALANKYKSKAFIHTGTSLPDDISPYALTKNTFVKLAKFNKENSTKFINVELEHFYGPNDDQNKFISYVINKCIINEPLTLTEGTQKRDFIYIEDVVDAYKIIIKNIENVSFFECIPLGSGCCPTVREVVETIHKCSNSETILEFGGVPMRKNELMLSCANIKKLNKLGWSAKYSLKQGLNGILKGQK